MKTIPTIRDVPAESEMKKLKIPHATAVIPYSKIDIAGSLENMARTVETGTGKAIDPAIIYRYVGSMEHGEPFPMPVLARRANGSYLALGGNHRLEAWKQVFGGEYEVECYIVDGQNERAVDLLPRSLNLRHGQASPLEVSLELAICARENHGFSIKDAEALACLRPGQLSDELQYKQAKMEISGFGLNADMLAKRVVQRLGTLRDNRNVFKAAAKVAVGAKLKQCDAEHLLKQVKAEKTEASRIAVIEKFDQALLKPSVNGAEESAKNKIRKEFVGSLTRFENAIRGKRRLSQLQISNPDEKASIIERLDTLNKCLAALCKSAQRH